jgi:hypothetical protein
VEKMAGVTEALAKAAFLLALRSVASGGNLFQIAPTFGVDILRPLTRMAASTVERVGENKKLPIRSRLGGSSGEAIRRTPEPEKTDGLCEDSLG